MGHRLPVGAPSAVFSSGMWRHEPFAPKGRKPKSMHVLEVPSTNRVVNRVNQHTLMKGWQSTMTAPREYTRDQAIAHDTEWAELMCEIHELNQRHDRLAHRGDQVHADYVSAELLALAAMVMYQYRVWRKRGMWPRYYLVLNGSMHTTLSCKTLNGKTLVRMCAELSGTPLEAVTARHKMCRHCGHAATADAIDVAPTRYMRTHHLV